MLPTPARGRRPGPLAGAHRPPRRRLTLPRPRSEVGGVDHHPAVVAGAGQVGRGPVRRPRAARVTPAPTGGPSPSSRLVEQAGGVRIRAPARPPVGASGLVAVGLVDAVVVARWWIAVGAGRRRSPAGVAAAGEVITSVGRRRTGTLAPGQAPQARRGRRSPRTAAAAAITTKPSAIGIVITTGRNAPTTHVSWNRVSKRANDRPRLASGASRWTTESNASFPLLAASPTHERQRGRGGEAPGPGGHEAGDRGAGEHDLQDALLGHAGAPHDAARPATRAARRCRSPPSTTPNCHVGASPTAVENASRNVRKPTMPRSTPMADAARTMPPPRSSARSVSDVRSAATWVAGTLMPNTRRRRTRSPPAPATPGCRRPGTPGRRAAPPRT